MIPGVFAAASQPPQPSVETAWDSDFKGAGISLSEGGLLATRTTGAWQSVYATRGKGSGKYQFELEHVAGSGANRPILGLADKTGMAVLLGSYLGSNSDAVMESLGYWGTGRLYWRLSTGTGEQGGLSQTAAGWIVTITLDLTLVVPEAKFYAQGTLGHTQPLPASKLWFPAASLQNGGSARLIGSGLTYPQPGFTDWDN